MTLEEKELILEIKRDITAFEVVYEKHFKAIYAYVARRVGCKQEVQEIVSQTFLNALKSIKKFKWQGVGLKSWLYKIACNNVKQWYRKQKRGRYVSLDMLKPILGDENELAIKYTKIEAKEKIFELFAQLSAEEVEILRLKYFEDVSNIDIAHIVGITPNHVGVKLYRILKKCEKILSHYEL